MEIVENMGDPLFWGAYAALWRFFAGVARGRRRRDELNMCGVPTPAIEPPTERSTATPPRDRQIAEIRRHDRVDRQIRKFFEPPTAAHIHREYLPTQHAGVVFMPLTSSHHFQHSEPPAPLRAGPRAPRKRPK
jgi:hypothetical protein